MQSTPPSAGELEGLDKDAPEGESGRGEEAPEGQSGAGKEPPIGESGAGKEPTKAESGRRRDFSAGGVVVRDCEVIVITPARRRSLGDVLALPKGHPDGGESELEAAVREVREETGVRAEPIEKLGDISYTYERRGHQIDKRVAFYLFEYREGELEPDHEIASAQWMPLEQAARSLTYEGEREMVQRALSRYASDR